MRNKRKDNFYENGGFNNIKKFSFFIIIFSFIILIIEYIYLYSLQNDTYNNNNLLLEYRDFYKLYFQLFSSTIGVACLLVSNNSVNLIETFTNEYYANNEDEYFNLTLFVIAQNKILAKNMMDKKVYLSTVHKTIGNKKYNELFGKKNDFFRVSQNINQGRLNFTLSRVNLEFSEAILTICNSFQILVNGTNNPVILLNKLENPFKTINENNQNYNNEFLNDYQKEFYEMILNYRLYYQEFNSIYEKLNTILFSKSNYIEAFIYFFITVNILLILLLLSAVYIYSAFFESMLIKIINYINMALNANNEDFNFSINFGKKIENLENLLEFNNYDPIEAMKNLNNLYFNYQQFLTTKNKNNVMKKKNYKKMMDENKRNELDDIPKNQRIMSKEEVKELGITYIYKLVYFISFILFLASYIILLCLWMNYFYQKSNLYTLIQKNISLEMSIYRAINAYDLMVFHNNTIEEISRNIILNNINSQPNYILNSFYNDIELAFNNKKEINKINTLYQDSENEKKL